MWCSNYKSFIFLSIVQFFGNALSANILFFDAIGTHSTRLSQWPLMEALAERGHNVTYLSSQKFVQEKDSKVNSFQPMIWSEDVGNWDDQFNFYQLRKKKPVVTWEEWTGYLEVGILGCEKLYSKPGFVEWVKSSKFDFVVVETYMCECAFGLIHHWGSKWALYSTSTNTPWFSDGFGIPDETSTIPEMTTSFLGGHGMTFTERFVNALSPVGMNLWREYKYFPALEDITRRHLGTDFPSFREVEKNVTVIYMTQHYSMDFARNYPSNVVVVGGNVVSKKIKPLPEDLEKFVSSGDNGFIYVSFGTVADFTHFDEQVQIRFINALASFKELKFIWKSHNPINATAIPENVFVTKWAPQQSLLAHPKIKGYVTHAGLGSTTEGIHFSVPLIASPVLGDQDANSDMIVRRGAGIKLEIIDMKQHQLEDAIKEILYNPKYKEGMNRLTTIFKDRPLPPLENAVWWTEYVLRHDNVQEFLVHPSIHQPWWKRRQIDVWVTAALLLSTTILISSYILLVLIKSVASLFKKQTCQTVKVKKQ